MLHSVLRQGAGLNLFSKAKALRVARAVFSGGTKLATGQLKLAAEGVFQFSLPAGQDKPAPSVQASQIPVV